ncbi:hypothetical protein CDAR_387221 [Caerostris darwini]|uniref:SHSP domain-containing protein n=1 Tax=Caerostris darwini TaxID=1538125 RepID=A0AAV4MWJ1_9ARAC|nr:hypothetical protein CDAR_387221 [Caerostris darwini]
MALASLLDDYLPLVPRSEHRRRRSRPHLLNALDMLENEMDQTVGKVVRRLPAALLKLDDDYETNGRKRKLKSGAMSLYEPKTKVQVTTKDNKFQVQLDTSNYQPDEINVKVVNDRLAISAKHEAKSDGVYEYHEMTRSFDLPEGVDPESVTSRLTINGQLTIEAPMKPANESSTERVIPVQVSKEPQPIENSENKDSPKKQNK